jgi:hypothetical protein
MKKNKRYVAPVIGRACKKCGSNEKYADGHCIKCKISQSSKSYQPKNNKRIKEIRLASQNKQQAIMLKEKRYNGMTCGKCGNPNRHIIDHKCIYCKYIRSIAKKYNLSCDQYKSMLIEQKYSCKICLTHQDYLKKRLCVDHDHFTNTIRGLICDDCNVAIGRLKDNIQIAKNLVSYLSEAV